MCVVEECWEMCPEIAEPRPADALGSPRWNFVFGGRVNTGRGGAVSVMTWGDYGEGGYHWLCM